MSISSDVMGKIENFKYSYLGSFIQKNKSLGIDVKHKIKCSWMKWRVASGVLCDKKISMTLKCKLYRSVVRTTILYDSEC